MLMVYPTTVRISTATHATQALTSHSNRISFPCSSREEMNAKDTVKAPPDTSTRVLSRCVSCSNLAFVSESWYWPATRAASSGSMQPLLSPTSDLSQGEL